MAHSWKLNQVLFACVCSKIFICLKYFLTFFLFQRSKSETKASRHSIHSSSPVLRQNSPQNHQRNIVGFIRGLVSSKSKEDQRQNRVFGRDLIEHLTESHEKGIKKYRNFFKLDSRNLSFLFSVPTIVQVCSKCIERYGIVDGIYRLSGISSNIRALK